MDVLILGGTGAMGKPLVQYCVDEGYSTYVTSRKNRESNNEKLSYYHIDAHSKEFDSFIEEKHFDCIVDFMSYSLHEFEKKIDVILPRTKQYIFLSSARVFNEAKIIDERSPRLLDSSTDETFLSTEEYSLTKAREEDILDNSRYRNWVIMRPYITYNDERMQLGIFEKEDWLFRAINGKTVIIPKDLLNKKTTMTYGPDVAKCIFSLIGRMDILGQDLNITTDESHTWKTVLDYYSEAFEDVFGYRFRYKAVGNQNTFSKAFPGQRYQIAYCRMFDRVFDNTKCRSLVDDTFIFTSLKDGLKNSLREYKNKDTPLEHIDPIRQAYFDRLAHEMTPLELFCTYKQKTIYISSRFFPMSYSLYVKGIDWIISIRKKLSNTSIKD